MDGMEEKLGAILSNPEMMKTIMSMAQTLNPQEEAPTPAETPKESAPPPPVPEIDLSMVQKLSGLTRQGNIDREQRALLSALGPYLSKERIRKLENAMRAAKMAGFAAAALGQQGAYFQSGR